MGTLWEQVEEYLCRLFGSLKLWRGLKVSQAKTRKGKLDIRWGRVVLSIEIQAR